MPDIKIGSNYFRYETVGKGEPLLFISGMGGDNDAWKAQLRSHSRRFACITFDNRGIGGSAAAAAGLGPEGYTLSLLAEDAIRLLDALGIDRAHVVGASMGGAIAQRLALDHPGRILSLSLHSTLARMSARSRLRFETQLQLLEKVDVVDVLMSLAPMIWSERTLTERFHVIEAFRAARKEGGAPVSKAVYRLQLQALLDLDLLPRLGEIKAPVLVTAGADDGLIPAAESRLISKAIPGSAFHVFGGCGHASSMENSRGFNAVSLGFLKKHEGGAT
ncbi:MAG: alpha/beta fold hydrolase [Spirochaetota bacterium]